MASNAAQHIEEDQPRLALPFLMNDVDKEQCEQGVDSKWVSGCMLLRRTCRIGINYLHDSLLAEEKREEEKTCRWFRKEAWQHEQFLRIQRRLYCNKEGCEDWHFKKAPRILSQKLSLWRL